MPDALAEQLKDSKIKLQQGIKSKMFDFIAAVLLVALIALSLGVIERRAITLDEIGDIIVECIPFFFAAMLLNDNFYKKGIFVGKTADNFVTACKTYSGLVANLTGKHIDAIDDFCQEFNDDAITKIQTALLKRASISYERFEKGYEKGEEHIEPLKVWSKKALIHKYGKERSKWIIKAQNVQVKGLHANTLLGTNDASDVTDIGETEAQLSAKKTITSVITYFVSTLIMSFIAVKNVTEWGWFGIALVLFKCLFILCKSYMAYYDGYNDVTIRLVHHTNRKTDILKQFLYWFSKKIEKPYNFVDDGNNIEILE